jgi:hypothetical protein
VTSVTREVTTTSVVLWALLRSAVRDTTPATDCGRLGRPETLAAPCSRAGAAPGGAADALSGLLGIVVIGADAAMATGWVTAATSVSTLSAAGGAGIFTVVAPATFRVTLCS